MSLFFLLAAGSLPTLILGAPLPFTLLTRADGFLSALTEKRSAGFGDVYTQYGGSGEQGWPSMSDWADFDTLFAKNTAVISQSCTQFSAANPSDSEISDIKSAIMTVAGESGVDERFILAIMMQESNGCVRAPTTNYGVRNPGLMQDHNGAATCNEGSQTNPCPASTITQMIRDGVEGTSSGDGLKQCIAEADASGAASYYRAARIYNSGSISDDNLSDGVATHCYSSDVANRLTGWVHGSHACNLDGAAVAVNTVMPTAAGEAPVTSQAPAAPTFVTSQTPTLIPTPAITITPTTPSAAATTASQNTPTTAATLEPAFSDIPTYGAPAGALPTGIPEVESPHKAQVSEALGPIASPTKVLDPTATATPTSTQAAATPDATKAPGVAADCSQYYTVAGGDNCWSLGQKFGFTFAQFQSWNTQIDGACSNLWKSYSYCVRQ